VNTFLPRPPESLRGAARAFYDELLRMLDKVRPAELDRDRSSVKLKDDSLELTLQHRTRPDWTIWATVGEGDSIVGTNWAHEHFFAPKPGEVEERPWTTEMVDFIAEILRGDIEIETTFRGNAALHVKHYNFDEAGERRPLGRTGFLDPRGLLVWRSKRKETERGSWL
jgi:hypothetical protein